MNPVTERLLSTEQVLINGRPEPLHSNMTRDEGELLQELIRRYQPAHSLEIGMAYGLSTLYICEALAGVGKPAKHIVLDMAQSTDWHGMGLQHVREAGYEHLIEFHESRAEYVLPRLAESGHKLDFALLDGGKRFEVVLTNFFYVHRMLRTGGIVAFDDANWDGIGKVIRHVLTYPCYSVLNRTASGVSLLGRIRRKAGRVDAVQRFVHPRKLRPDWDLGIGGRCVVLQKTVEDERSWDWHRDF